MQEINSYKLYTNVKDLYDRMFTAISSAKKTIYLESYILDDDHIGRELIRRLALASEHTKIKVIVDGYGFEGFKDRTQRLIKNANIEFIEFNPWSYYLKNGQLISMFRKMQNRTHRKVLIIDEEIAFLGGVNFAERELKWFDTHLEIKGPLVQQIVLSFKEMHSIATRNQFDKKKITKKLTKRFKQNDIIVRQIPGTRYHRPLKRNLLRLIKQSKKSIYITTPYFIPDLKFLFYLKKAKKRKVNVTIVIPKKTDSKLTDILSKVYCFFLWQAKINILLYPKMTHAKFAIFDDVCTLGSANFDYRGFNHNYELNIISKNKDLLEQLNITAQKQRELSTEFDSVAWQKERGFFYKVLEKILIYYKKYF